jgi:hypothetical protein
VQWISAAGWISRQKRDFRKGSVVAELFARVIRCDGGGTASDKLPTRAPRSRTLRSRR